MSIKPKLAKQNFLHLRSGVYTRSEEFEMIFKYWDEYLNGPVLEIGSGEGMHFRSLCTKFSEVIASDLDVSRWDKSLGKIHKMNATCIPFSDNSFGLIYSSNVLEHVSDINLALEEMRRVLKADGKMLHIVPTVTWKITQLLGYYPAKFRDFIATGVFPKLKPSVHGVSDSHVEELNRFKHRYWENKFIKAGFSIADVSNLLFYSPYRFLPNWLKLRKFIAAIGITSCRAYLVSKDD